MNIIKIEEKLTVTPLRNTQFHRLLDPFDKDIFAVNLALYDDVTMYRYGDNKFRLVIANYILTITLLGNFKPQDYYLRGIIITE